MPRGGDANGAVTPSSMGLRHHLPKHGESIAEHGYAGTGPCRHPRFSRQQSYGHGGPCQLSGTSHSIGSMWPRFSTTLNVPFVDRAMYMFMRTWCWPGHAGLYCVPSVNRWSSQRTKTHLQRCSRTRLSARGGGGIRPLRHRARVFAGNSVDTSSDLPEGRVYGNNGLTVIDDTVPSW